MKKYSSQEIDAMLYEGKGIVENDCQRILPGGDYSEWDYFCAAPEEKEIIFPGDCVFAEKTMFENVHFLSKAEFGKHSIFRNCQFSVSENFPDNCTFEDTPFYKGNVFGNGCKFMGHMVSYGLNNTFGKKCVFDVGASTSGKCTFGKKCIILTKEGGYEKIKAGKRKLKEVYPE